MSVSPGLHLKTSQYWHHYGRFLQEIIVRLHKLQAYERRQQTTVHGLCSHSVLQLSNVITLSCLHLLPICTALNYYISVEFIRFEVHNYMPTSIYVNGKLYAAWNYKSRHLVISFGRLTIQREAGVGDAPSPSEVVLRGSVPSVDFFISLWKFALPERYEQKQYIYLRDNLTIIRTSRYTNNKAFCIVRDDDVKYYQSKSQDDLDWLIRVVLQGRYLRPRRVGI